MILFIIQWRLLRHLNQDHRYLTKRLRPGILKNPEKRSNK